MRWLTLLVVWLPAMHAAMATEPLTGDEGDYRGYAQVLQVTPILTRKVEQVPVRQCRWEDPHGRRHQCRARPVRRCRTILLDQDMDSIGGYRVTFRYNGEVFRRTVKDHPGDRLLVNIRISPLEHGVATQLTETEHVGGVFVQPAFR